MISGLVPQLPRIAVIVPNFNDSRHIGRCLKALLEQSVPPDELVVVDDCSTDNSVEVIRSIIDGRPGVELVCNPKNLGVYGALDAGSRLVNCDYIMFVAANDFVFPGIIEHAKHCIARYPGVGLWSGMGWLVDDHDRSLGPLALAVPALQDRYFPPQDCVQMAWRLGNWFAGPTVVYHKETLESVGRFNPEYRGLADLISALMIASKRGAIFVPVPYAVFRQHEGSYLASTLVNPEVLIPLLSGMAAKAPALAPELFDPAFCQRIISRFVFAAVRASGGRQIAAYPAILESWQARWLARLDCILPENWRLLRVVAAFLVLRSYDVWPSLWNRMLGTAIVARRHRLIMEGVLSGNR